MLDGADDGGGVLDRIWRQFAGVGPHELGAFSGLADDGFAVPVAGFEREPDAGVRGAGVALVNGQGQAQGSGVEGDAGFFPRFADACFEYVFAFFEVAAGQAELAAGVHVPGPAQQQDLPGTAEDDVDVDDAGEAVRHSGLRVRGRGVLPGSR